MDIKMIRPYTEEEKEILRKGLEDGEVNEEEEK
jgi:hypothetical protein